MLIPTSLHTTPSTLRITTLATAFFSIFVHLPAILWFYQAAGPVCILLQISPVLSNLVESPTSYLLPIPILLGTLNLFLLLLRVLAVFILILLYVFQMVSQCSHENLWGCFLVGFFFFPVQLFEMFRHQICDFFFAFASDFFHPQFYQNAVSLSVG